MSAHERGSVVALTNGDGYAIAIDRYDEYGIPQAGNVGRFGYTGQKWLSQLGLYDYKARMYSPTLGRFMQTDPIGYADGVNWYNYVGSDPVNFTDPSGLQEQQPCGGDGQPDCPPIVIIAKKLRAAAEYASGWVTVWSGYIKAFNDGVGGARARTPQSPQPVRSKTYIRRKLANNGYDPQKAWSEANSDRKSKTNGSTNWNNPIYREGENWLTAASDFYPLPFARTPQIYLHQYRKMLPFSGSTPFSQEALDAGLDGQAHNGDTPEQLEAWCNGN